MIDELLWYVYHEPYGGLPIINAEHEDLTEAEADAILEHFAEINERKPHKHDYGKISYPLGKKKEVAIAHKMLPYYQP